MCNTNDTSEKPQAQKLPLAPTCFGLWDPAKTSPNPSHPNLLISQLKPSLENGKASKYWFSKSAPDTFRISMARIYIYIYRCYQPAPKGLPNKASKWGLNLNGTVSRNDMSKSIDQCIVMMHSDPKKSTQRAPVGHSGRRVHHLVGSEGLTRRIKSTLRF